MTGAAENPDCATVWTVEEDTGDDDCKDVEGKVLPAENHSSKLEISVSILAGWNNDPGFVKGNVAS